MDFGRLNKFLGFKRGFKFLEFESTSHIAAIRGHTVGNRTGSGKPVQDPGHGPAGGPTAKAAHTACAA
jgi:hypothetical protein